MTESRLSECMETKMEVQTKDYTEDLRDEFVSQYFKSWNENDQNKFVQALVSEMSHYQHSQINLLLQPMLQRDFITLLPSMFYPQFSMYLFSFFFTEKGLDHVAENILTYIDEKSLCSAELVCKEWHRVISEGMLWKKLIESRVRSDSLWKGLAHRRGW